MDPKIIIYSVKSDFQNTPLKKKALAAFDNVELALIFWNALPEVRKKYYVMETILGESVLEVAHTGWNENYKYFSHAYALTFTKPNPPRTRDREDAEKQSWEFVKI